MIFYHFTGHHALPGILAEGLNRGEAPISDTRVATAVNLTTDRDPSGHGLDGGGEVITAEQSAYYRLQFGWDIPAGSVVANKRAVRITIKLPSTDRNLRQWRSWSRKNCEPGYADRLEAAAGHGGRKAKTWWLYFGVIPPSAFVAVDILEPDDTA